MKISIFGMGYVGCVSGACFAEMGHTVLGVEPSALKVGLINHGKSPIVETGLDALIEKVVQRGAFRATSDWEAALRESDLALVCVGTPSRSNGSIDLQYVHRVCEQIGAGIAARSTPLVVVIRSTVMPGTLEGSVIPLLEKASGKKVGRDFGVCMHPEFLRESTAIHDFYHPPKTVIGEYDQESGRLLASLYKDIPGPLVRTSLRVAEMVKYADNCFHALKVTFANEIGNICKEAAIDSHQVMEIFCQDTKLNLSPYYLKPGFAFGGSCLPKDLRAIIHEAKTQDLEVPLLSAVLESNKLQVLKVIRQLLKHKGRKLGFLGLSFKGGTDDLRESPIVEVIEAMLGKGFAVRIYDRHVSLARLTGANKEYIEREIPHISRLISPKASELVAECDVIVVTNKEAEFREVLTPLPPGKLIIDLVRIFPGLPDDKNLYQGICW
jgi:GDP-mannose 6-dehydrogenase